MKFIRTLYNWMSSKVHSPYANWWLAGFFFIESFCFPIPVDPLLILFCIENRSRSFFYAGLVTLASVAGGICGYIIGACLWDTVGKVLVESLISPEAFEKARHTYELYENWAVLIAGFTPLPYKAVTLSAGFCKLPIIPFIFYSCLGRGARFFLVAGIIRIWGAQIKIFIDRYFNHLILLFTFLVVVSAWALM